MISEHSETYLLGLDMKASLHPMGEISSGSELDDGTNQDGELPMNVLTAATKTRLSPGFYANILSLFEECFQNFGYYYYYCCCCYFIDKNRI